jgi:hypothetical protein
MKVFAVGDLEPRQRVDVDAHAPLLCKAERAPAHESGHCPREVIVQARQGDVRRSIRVVDREHLALSDDRLA